MKEEVKKEVNQEREEFPWFGILLLIIAILGYCYFGRVSLLIKLVCATLVGDWYNLLLLAIAIYGIFLIVQHQPIHFLSEKYVKIYIIILSLLLLSHISVLKNMSTVDTDHFSFVEDTRLVVENYVDNIFNSWEAGHSNLPSHLGGGVLACLLASILVSALTATWASVLLIIVILFTLWTVIRVPIQKKFKKEQEESEEIEQESNVEEIEEQEEVIEEDVPGEMESDEDEKEE